MARSRPAVRDLAKEADLDLEETLVTLWDAGIDEVKGPEDYIHSRNAARARRALGVPARRELTSAKYWRNALKLEEGEWHTLLEDLSIAVRPGSRTLPTGAVRKLRAHARGGGKLLKTDAAVEANLVIEEQPQRKTLRWNPLGHERPLRWLTEEEVRQIHHSLVADFATGMDPIDPPGIRNETLFGSAVFRPHTALGGQLKYPTVESSAAALLHAMVQDHPFHNGNKRTALVGMLVFLDENGLMLTCDEDELFRLVLQLARHRLVADGVDNLPDREVLEVTKWICSNSRLIKKGERPLVWRKLKQILVAYGCDLEIPRGVGNRMNISRQSTATGIFGRTKKRELWTQVFCPGDGREAEIDTLKKIRADLHLDELHGFDSRAFYEAEDVSVAHFILKYRKTLRRLAKL